LNKYSLNKDGSQLFFLDLKPVKYGLSLQNMSSDRQIFTLKQVASSIKKTMEQRYQQHYWVKAEMHKLNLFPSGHCFPELLQKEQGKIVAQMSASIWSHNYQRINKRFVEIVKEPLRDDSTFLMQVKIVFHEIYGFSLQILDIDPNYALGELQKERQETLLRLQHENIINLNQSLPFPLLPKRIAIISAEASKGLSDFKKVIDSNPWNYQFFTFLFQAYLQGDQAVVSIQEQLKKIEKVKAHFDVVVIVRGGGGEVGLSCYNHYELCKAITTFPLPILTGIGHSTNLTVAEMVAHRNAITPTELGDYLIQSFHDFAVPLKDAIKSIRNFAKSCLEQSKKELNSEVKLFKNVTFQQLNRTKDSLISRSASMKSNTKYQLHREQEYLITSHKSINKSVKTLLIIHSNRVTSTSEKIGKHSLFALKTTRIRLESIYELISKTIWSTLQVHDRKLEQATHSIKQMDPIQVLKRGYSITTVNGKTLSDTESIEQGMTIFTKTFFGEIESEVSRYQVNNQRP
jgi:exodeoxyribonuclease VII large subunit